MQISRIVLVTFSALQAPLPTDETAGNILSPAFLESRGYRAFKIPDESKSLLDYLDFLAKPTLSVCGRSPEGPGGLYLCQWNPETHKNCELRGYENLTTDNVVALLQDVEE